MHAHARHVRVQWLLSYIIEQKHALDTQIFFFLKNTHIHASHSCPSIGWLVCHVGRSVGHNFRKGQRSYTSMLLSKHLLSIWSISSVPNVIKTVNERNCLHIEKPRMSRADFFKNFQWPPRSLNEAFMHIECELSCGGKSQDSSSRQLLSTSRSHSTHS